MREINITNDVIDFLRKALSNNLSHKAIVRQIGLKGWTETCNEWDRFLILLEQKNLDKIFTDFEFYIRY